jgi:hypothetical protein
VLILAVGILISVLSRTPMEKKRVDSTDISWDGMVLSEENVTYDLDEVDDYNHVTVAISRIKEQPFGWPSEQGLYYYFYTTEEPSVKRYENWTNVHNVTDYTLMNITEEGHWFLYLKNEGNITLSFTLGLEWIQFSRVPVLPGRNLTYGILLIIYAVLFISIIAMRDRFKRRGRRTSESTHRNREKSNTD